MSEVREFPLLALQGQFLCDVEAIRVANDNRIRALREDLGVKDGPEITTALQLADVFKAAEPLVEKDLRRALRATPFHEWVTATVGVGEKQAARLLAVIGHPCWRYCQDTETWLPRTVGQLWSYCGYAVREGVAPRRARGQQAAYNTDARTRCYLIAESCIKQAHSPYRAVYDTGRAKYTNATHPHDCPRCGPSGKPAKAGSALSAGHQHARAMRLAAKAMLKDLWVAAGEAEHELPIAA